MQLARNEPPAFFKLNANTSLFVFFKQKILNGSSSKSLGTTENVLDRFLVRKILDLKEPSQPPAFSMASKL